MDNFVAAQRFLVLPAATTAAVAVMGPFTFLVVLKGPLEVFFHLGFLPFALVFAIFSGALWPVLPYFAFAGFLYGLLAGAIPARAMKGIVRSGPPLREGGVSIVLGLISSGAAGAVYDNAQTFANDRPLLTLSLITGALCGPALWFIVRWVRNYE